MQGRLTSAASSSALYWTIAAGVGIFLGAYTVGASFLLPRLMPLLVLAVLWPFVAMVVGDVRRLFLAIIMLDIPLQIDIYLDYQDKAADLGAIGGFNISLTTISLVILYALWLAELLVKKESQSRSLFRMSLQLASYMVATILSLTVARDSTLSLFEIFLLLQMFLLYIYIINSIRTRRDILFIITMLLIGLVLESLIMIGSRYVGGDLRIGGISSRVDVGSGTSGGSYRVGGTVGSPNDAASYLSMLLAPAISLLLLRIGRWYKRLAVLSFGLGGIALILTLSRGGWVVFTLSTALLCLLAWRRGWLSLTAPIVITLVVAVLFLPFQDAIFARLFGNDNGSAFSRIPLMKLTLRVIKDNPILGVGSNNLAIVVSQYATPEFGGAWLYVVHNKYLRVWAETGIIGLITFIWFLLAIIRRGWSCFNCNDRFLSPLALGFTAAILGQMIHMFVDVFFSRPQVQLLCVIAGLITVMHNLNDNGDSTAERDFVDHRGQGRVVC